MGLIICRDITAAQHRAAVGRCETIPAWRDGNSRGNVQNLRGHSSAIGLEVIKTPVRVPQANAFCERLIGTTRRECLDFVIPMSERHLRATLREWIRHYNRGRPHSSLGPGIPEGSAFEDHARESGRHRLPERSRVVATPILGGLHHEYRLEKAA